MSHTLHALDHLFEFEVDNLMGSIEMQVYWRQEPMHKQSFGSADEVSEWIDHEFCVDLGEYYESSDEIEEVEHKIRGFINANLSG